MSIETITTFFYIWISISVAFPLIAILLWRKIESLKVKEKKLNSETRFYEEMLYASRDGYMTFSIYNNKEFQFCSRRLATLLNLKNGEQSTKEEVFANFIKGDKEKLETAFKTLKNTGLSFEIIIKTHANKAFSVFGSKVNSLDNLVDSCCLWFRDISKERAFINDITDDALYCRGKIDDYRTLIDNLPYPVWLRDENMSISLLNKKYLNLLGLHQFNEITPENSTLHDLGNTTDLFELASKAKESNITQKKQINILNNGELKKYEITETPCYNSETKNSHVIGSLIDITSFNEAKLNYQVHLETHLEILSSLDTAFCIVNTKHIFTFTNQAFLKLWNLSENFTDTLPSYSLFLDKVREQKNLPEIPDFNQYKREENKALDELTEQREDLLYIPDGRTIRRIRAPHPDGTIIAYEDITDHLNITRRLNDLEAIQKTILNNINDSVLIVTPSLKLRTYNQAFLKLWELDEESIKDGISLKDLIDLTKKSLPEVEHWEDFRDNILKHLTARTSFNLMLKNKKEINVSTAILADTSLMITYH